MNRADQAATADFGPMGRAGMVLGVIGLIGLGVGFFVNQGSPDHVKSLLQSYLYGWIFAMLFALGCYGFMLLHYMSKGSWGKPTIRIFEAGAKTLPLMLLLFLPVLIWHGILYPWANPDLLHGNPTLGIKPDEVLAHRERWMNIAMFTGRTVVYFGIWFGFTSILTYYSRRQDETGDTALAAFRQKLSAYGFVIYIITITFAFTDWVMSLDAHWFSTIYGLWFMDFQGLAAIAFVSLMIARFKMARKEPYNTLVDTQVTRDLGNLMLTLVMIWAYFSLSQWIIIWSGNLPEELVFYLKRNSGMFLLVGALNIVFSFFAPFVMLLSGRTKRTPEILAGVSVLLLIMRVIDLFWVVIPATRHPIAFRLTDAAALLFAFGAFLAAFAYYVRQTRLVPQHDEPLAQEVFAHG